MKCRGKPDTTWTIPCSITFSSLYFMLFRGQCIPLFRRGFAIMSYCFSILATRYQREIAIAREKNQMPTSTIKLVFIHIKTCCHLFYRKLSIPPYPKLCPVSDLPCICPASALSCIRPVLHPSCTATILSCIHPVLHLPCPASLLSCIWSVQHLTCPESIVSCISPVLHPSCPLSDLPFMWPVLHPSCPASVRSYIQPVLQICRWMSSSQI